jgi:hypothetical protein
MTYLAEEIYYLLYSSGDSERIFRKFRIYFGKNLYLIQENISISGE